MPTQHAGSPFATTWSGAGTKTAGGGLSVGIGDLVVVECMDEAAGQTVFPATPTNTGTATLTWTQTTIRSSGSFCGCAGYTGSVTGAGTLTVQIAHASGMWGMIVWAYPSTGHGGLGLTPANVAGTATAPTLTGAWTASSEVCCLNGDFTAAAHGTRTYRTGNGTPTEDSFANTDSNYTVEAFRYPTSPGGSQAVGMTVPASQTWTLVTIEVKAPAAAAALPFLAMARR